MSVVPVPSFPVTLHLQEEAGFISSTTSGWLVVDSNEISHEPFLLHFDQTQLSQPVSYAVRSSPWPTWWAFVGICQYLSSTRKPETRCSLKSLEGSNNFLQPIGQTVCWPFPPLGLFCETAFSSRSLSHSLGLCLLWQWHATWTLCH